MRIIYCLLALTLWGTPALAAEPSPSPAPLPIRNVTVEFAQPGRDGAGAHIERPPLPRQYRLPAPSASPSPAPSPAHR